MDGRSDKLLQDPEGQSSKRLQVLRAIEISKGLPMALPRIRIL